MDPDNLPYLNFGLAVTGIIASLGTTLFFIGKWAGAKDYIHKEITRLEGQVQGLHNIIEGMRKETKDDRHMFRGDLQRWQEGLLGDINNRFDRASLDAEKVSTLLRDEMNRRFDNLDCIKNRGK